MTRRWLLFLAGLGISALACYWILSRTDVNAVWSLIRGLRLESIAAIVGVYAAGFLPRAWRTVVMAEGFAVCPPRVAAEAVVLGYASNNVLPLRLGEVVRVLFTSARLRASKTASFALVAAERLIDATCLAVVLLGAIVGLALRPEPIPPALLALVVPVASVAGAAVISLIVVLLAYESLQRFLEKQRKTRITHILGQLLHSIAYLRSPRKLAIVSLLTLAVWLCEGGMFVLTCVALDIKEPVLAGYLALAIANLSVLIPSSPGYLGVFHAAVVFALQPLGIASDRALAVGILSHALPYLLVTFAGLIIFLRHHALLLSFGHTLKAPVSENSSLTEPRRDDETPPGTSR